MRLQHLMWSHKHTIWEEQVLYHSYLISVNASEMKTQIESTEKSSPGSL